MYDIGIRATKAPHGRQQIDARVVNFMLRSSSCPNTVVAPPRNRIAVFRSQLHRLRSCLKFIVGLYQIVAELSSYEI
jgi:hypothetical protein